MKVILATWLVRSVYAYLLIGLVVFPWIHRKGLARLDRVAGLGPWGFRILITPGLIALWPLVLSRARSREGHPAEERNAHRCAAHS